MKLSKMVELMWSFIQTVEYDYDLYMDKEDTSKLLDKMIEAGMLPPGQDKDKITVTRLDGTLIGTSFDSHEWEEE